MSEREIPQEFQILDHLPTGHCVLGSDARIIFWNHTLEVWTQISAETLEGTSVFEAFPNLLDPRLRDRLIAALARGVPAVFSHMLTPQFFPSQRLSGSMRIQHTSIDRIEPDEDGDNRMLLTLMDVTDQVQREERVRAARAEAQEEARNRKASEERFRTLVELATDAIFVAGTQGKILDCNSAAGLMFLRPWDEFEGLEVRTLLTPNHRHLFERLVNDTCQVEFERVEAACVRGDGSSFPAEISAKSCMVGFSRQVVVYVHDLTLQKRAEEALRKANEALENLSFTDPLTGLRNRRFFDAYIRRDLDRCVKSHQSPDGTGPKDLVFFLVDLDHFKQVNDTHGHAAGDAVLQQLASILTNALRQTDLVVRWGGEEFLMVAREGTRVEAGMLAERIRRSVEQHLFDLGNGEVLRRTCSVGMAIYPFLPSDPLRFSQEDVVALSDHAMYAAKRSGRNAWVGITPGDNLPVTVTRAELLGQTARLLSARFLELGTSLPAGTEINWP